MVLAIVFVAPSTWWRAAAGFIGYDPTAGSFRLIPPGADYFLLGALAGFSGAGGLINVTLSNWARDKGYGMSAHSGFIPAAIGGERQELAHSGATFVPNAESMVRWRGWWRIVRADQWGIFYIGALLGMALPAMLYVTFIPVGSKSRLRNAAVLARRLARRVMLCGTSWPSGSLITRPNALDISTARESVTFSCGPVAPPPPTAWDVSKLIYRAGVAACWGISRYAGAANSLLQMSANIHGVLFGSADCILYIKHGAPACLRPSLGRRLGGLPYSFTGRW